VVIDLNKPPPKADPNFGKPVDYGKPAEPKAGTAPSHVEIRQPVDDDGNDLQAQVEALKRREQAARSRADQERQARVAAEQEHIRAATQVQQERGQTESAQYDSISNALVARENEIKTLNVSYQDALARGDHSTAADINNRMLDAKMDMRDLTNGKAEFEREFERRRREPQRPQQQFQQPQQQQPQIEQILSQMAGLIPAERDWLREHPDALTNLRLQKKLEAAYLDAEDDGLERGSDEYFEFMEQRLGFTGAESRQRSQQPQYDEVDMDEPAPAPPRRRQSYAAPPSRSSPGTGERFEGGGKVELNTEQRMAAKISNVDEYTYAKGVQRLRELKKQGYYQEVG
jgi:cation transport regulator ChaC